MPLHIQTTKEHQTSKSEAAKIRKTLLNFCTDNNLHFFSNQSDLNKSVKINFNDTFDKTSLVLIHIHDLLFGDRNYWQLINKDLETAGKKLIVCTDSFNETGDFSNITFITSPALFGIKHLHVNPSWWETFSTNHQPEKLFNCFTHRVDPVRQSWFYFLHHKQLLDKGYVSFLFFNHDDPLQTELDLFDQNHRMELNNLDKFNLSYSELRNHVPYKNFKENFVLWDKICDSKYSLVLDSFATFDDQFSYFISEKVARVLMLPTFDLLFVQKNTIKKLESWGIVSNTSSLGIDELSWQQRQINILEYLERDPKEYDFTSLLDIARHNYNIFKNFYSSMDQFYEQVFDLAISK